MDTSHINIVNTFRENCQLIIKILLKLSSSAGAQLDEDNRCLLNANCNHAGCDYLFVIGM